MVFGKVSEPWGVGFGWSLSSARVQQFRWWEHSLMMIECLWAMWEWASLFEYPPGRAIYIFCFLLFSPLLTVPVCLLQNSLHTTLVSGALQQTQLSHCRKKWAVVPPKCPLMCPLYYGRFSGRTLLSISGSESVLLSPIVLVVQTEHCADCRSTCLRMLTPLHLRLAQKHLCHQHNDVG